MFPTNIVHWQVDIKTKHTLPSTTYVSKDSNDFAVCTCNLSHKHQ